MLLNLVTRLFLLGLEVRLSETRLAASGLDVLLPRLPFNWWFILFCFGFGFSKQAFPGCSGTWYVSKDGLIIILMLLPHLVLE